MDNISAVAKIRPGLPFRERVIHQATGKYLVVQGKDVGTDGTLTVEAMVRVTDVPGRGTPDVLHAGEVILQTRGMSYRAAIVPQASSPMVAAGSLFILSVDPARVLPEYLVFFLNLPGTQAALRQVATGTTILNLRRAAVEQLELPLPNFPRQRQLSELSDLTRRQGVLEGRLNLLRLQELHALAIECAKKAGGAVAPPASNRSGRRANASRPHPSTTRTEGI